MPSALRDEAAALAKSSDVSHHEDTRNAYGTPRPYRARGSRTHVAADTRKIPCIIMIATPVALLRALSSCTAPVASHRAHKVGRVQKYKVKSRRSNVASESAP